jgi:hypothetical protein
VFVCLLSLKIQFTEGGGGGGGGLGAPLTGITPSYFVPVPRTVCGFFSHKILVKNRKKVLNSNSNVNNCFGGI